MPSIQSLDDFEQMRILADPRRMQILRLLMAGPATLTQLAHTLRHSPAWVRHHLLSLQSTGLVELAEVRTTGKVTEKFYQAASAVFLLQQLIVPKSKHPVILFSGSDDPSLEWIASHLARHFMLLTLPVGSLGGLIHLRQRLCHFSGAHLLDESGEYNVPFIRHIFPDQPVRLVTLAQRTQGWMFQHGNPKGLRGVEDLARREICFVNRNPGSGTRLWIDRQLRAAGIRAADVNGYQQEVSTHAQAAARVAAGKADLSIGLESAARTHGLEFLPLFEERYDLAMLPEREAALLPVLEFIQTGAFRTALSSLAGYSSTQTGRQIPL